MRSRIAIVSIGLVVSTFSCAEHPDFEQREFVWHQGNAPGAQLPADEANPFRGRVSAAGITRCHEGDLDPDCVAAPHLDVLDPRIAEKLADPLSAPFVTPFLPGGFDPSGIDPRFGPFGGDYSGETPCLDPLGELGGFQDDCLIITDGCCPCFTGLPEDGANVRIVGGLSELPLRPAPDLGNLSPNPDARAQGLHYPFSGDTVFSRNVDPSTGRPRTSGEGGSCSRAPEVTEGPLGGGNPNDPRARFPVILGSLEFPGGPSTTPAGIGSQPACLKAGGAPGFENDNGILDPATGLTGAQNALEHHPANQSLFACICRSSVGAFSGLDPTACRLNLFGSSAFLNPLLTIPLVEILSTVFAGEVHRDISFQFLRAVQSLQADISTDGPIPIAPINRDPREPIPPGDPLYPLGAGDPGFGEPFYRGDGVITATDGRINRVGPGPDAGDFLTLDSGLTAAQRAHLGCGPYLGTRCDSSVALQVPLIGLSVTGAGGGVDPLHMTASAAFLAWADPATASLTSSSSPQPGTIGHAGPPACRSSSGDLLPGCRGLLSLELGSADGSPAWIAEYDAGFLPSIDGCVLAAELDGLPVVTPAAAPGSQLALELDECASGSDHREGDYLSASVAVPGARTLFHPLAGCEKAGDLTDCGLFFDRDLEREFAEGTAQIFRNEIAATSWNLQMFLVVTSCDLCDRGELEGCPGLPNREVVCFDPMDPFSAERCSLRAPHGCKNVADYLALTEELEPDGSSALCAFDPVPGPGDDD